MAVWQAKIYAVPSTPRPEGWEAWEGFSTLRAELDRLFQTAEITDFLGTQYWGDDQRHDARLCLDAPEEMLSIRIDLREPVAPFLQALSRLLSKCGLSLQDGDTLIEPTEENLVRIVGASNAARFVANPRAYMDDWARGAEAGN